MMVAAAAGQSTANHADASPPSPAASSDLAAQIESLRHKVHQLEEQMKSTMGSGGGGSSMSGMSMGDTKKDGMGMKKGMSRMNMSGSSDSAGGMNMSSGQQSGGMGMDKMGMMKGMGGMGGMSMSGGSDSASGMSMSDGQQSGGMGMMGMGGGMGMMGMMKGMGGGMSGMSGMSMPTALPGFPGASHLYHVGATGFFLDHGDHIQLTTEQQAKLNQLKEKTLLNQASADRKIEEAEQELWELTAADQPDAEALESKIREVETLRGDQRLAFIRAVGEAAKVLTHEQHQVLTGTEASPTKDAAPDHSNHQP